MQTRFIHGNMLQAIYLMPIADKEKSGDLLAPNALVMRDERRRVLRDLRHLPDLFVQRHPCHQTADETMHLSIWIGASLGEGPASDQVQQSSNE